MKFEKIKPVIFPTLLITVTFAVYARSLGHDFLVNWDDHLYVTNNTAIQGITLGHLKAAFTKLYGGNYAPLQIISYMADYAIWGGRPFGFILGNILFHLANGLLFYALLAKLTARRLWAFVAAFIFLVHPVQVESVVWISQRKSVLAMFFFLLAFWLYIRYRERGWQQGRFYYGASLAAFMLALLSKSVVVILPPLLILYDLSFVPKDERRRWLADKITFMVAAVVVALVAFIGQSSDYHGGRAPYHGGTPLTTFFTMLPVLVRYLEMLFWPLQLSAVYAPPIKTGVDGVVTGSALLLLVIGGGGVYLYRTRRDLWFWFCLFWLGLVPVAQIVPLVTLMNDRYLYFPMLGAAALVGGLAVSVMSAVAGRARHAVLFFSLLLLLLLPVLSYRRAEVWQDSKSLWHDATVKVPESREAWTGLAESYFKAGELDAALVYYRQALAIDPACCEALNNAAIICLRQGNLAYAREFLLRLTAQCPTYPNGFQNLGHYYYSVGNLPEAEKAFRLALELEPGSAAAMIALGNVRLAKGELVRAGEFFRQAQAAGGESAELEYDQACLAAKAGKPAEALRHLEASFGLGFANNKLLQNDPYLAPLRSRTDFRRLVSDHFPQRETK